MKGYVLSPLAQADMDEIWDYTVDRWGEAQAERYARWIENAIKMAVANPKRGGLVTNFARDISG